MPSIEFKNFSAKYDDNLPLTLKDLNFSIESNEKVGIVGRTGAGKSSIIQALFRIFEPETGSTFKIGHASWPLLSDIFTETQPQEEKVT